MTGYDQATSYPSQYNYVPNLQNPDAALVGGVDPRQLHGGWGMAAANQGHAHYTHMQGSPGAASQHHAGHRGYSYYDHNGYYVNRQHPGGGAVTPTGGANGSAAAAAAAASFDSWHDPSGLRPESPSALTAPPSYPSPAVATATTSGGSSVNYSCKMAVQPPAHSGAGATPPSPTQQKTNDNPQLQSPSVYGGGGQTQYGACQLNQNSQPPGGPATPYSNSSGGPPLPLSGGPPPAVHNSYCGSEAGSAGATASGAGGVHVGQPSPVQQPPGGGQNQQGAPQAPLPSPLYPWMRSQFGKHPFHPIYTEMGGGGEKKHSQMGILVLD